MSDRWLLLVFGALVLVMIMLMITYRKLQHHKKLIRLQSDEITRQLQELISQNKMQEQLNFEKQQIISVVSHDLKGPFNRIFALVQLMTMSEELSEEQREYLSKIHQIAADGLGMVRNLLDKRKLEDAGLDLTMVSINLTQVLLPLMKHYQSVAEQKKIHFEFQTPQSCDVVADRHFVTRVFENLFSNAIKFSPAHTTVKVTFTEENDHWLVAINDEGPGISAEDQEKMFMKFQRLSAKPTGGESSTGLGLWIVKTLTERMGGRVRCVSGHGHGAALQVRLKKSFE